MLNHAPERSDPDSTGDENHRLREIFWEREIATQAGDDYFFPLTHISKFLLESTPFLREPCCKHKMLFGRGGGNIEPASDTAAVRVPLRPGPVEKMTRNEINFFLRFKQERINILR